MEIDINNENILIREFKPGEEPEWLDLIASVMIDSYAWWVVLHKRIIHKNAVIDLVATHKGKLVGFTVAEINADVVKEKNTVMIWDFGVHRNYRGKDIGRSMIKHLHKIMNDKYGINKSIWYSQDPESIKYYRHIGMKEIGRHWQLTVTPKKEQFMEIKKNKFGCWYMRGDCTVEDFDEVRKNFNVMDDDDTLRPMICVGYEYVL